MGNPAPEPVDPTEHPTAAPHPPVGGLPAAAREFLPDAAEIESRPVAPLATTVLYALFGLITVTLLWATFSQLDKIVVARGRLVVPTGLIVVQPLETAVIRSLKARVGHTVRQGETLGTLDPTFTGADVNQLRGRRESLEAQVLWLHAELTGEPPPLPDTREARMQNLLFRERGASFRARIAQYAETLKRIEVVLTAAQQEEVNLGNRLDNHHEIKKMQEELIKGNSGSRLRLLEAQDLSLSILYDLDKARHRTIELRQSLATTQAEREAFAGDWRQKAAEELMTAQRELDGVTDQLSKAERKQELISLTSPVDAVVLEVAKRSVGSVVREAEPLFTLVPLPAELEAEVEIDPADIGLLRLQDPARLKLEAFPFQKHGTIPATVRMLSEDALSRPPGTNAAMGGEAATYYLGRLALGANELTGLPAGTRLLPGMTVTAEIVVGSRSVLSYFLYPVIRALDEGLREPR